MTTAATTPTMSRPTTSNVRRSGANQLSDCGSVSMARACAHRLAMTTSKGPISTAPDPDAARAVLAGNEFVFDVQGHFLEYRDVAGTAQGRDFWTGFPQRGCGESDPRLCFSIDRFMDEVFLRSGTSMVVLSGLPIAPV